MSQLSIKLSAKADALVAQLQKQIFNRRRKKVSAAGVIETLVESGAKSQSDKRFATSWKNLIADIEKAAKVADTHGVKPANLSDVEWALVLNHRMRSTPGKRSARAAAVPKTQATTQAKPQAQAQAKPQAPKAAAVKAKTTAAKAPSTNVRTARVSTDQASGAPAASRARKPGTRVRKTTDSTAVSAKASTKASANVAHRMAKAVGRLKGSAAAPATAAPSANGVGQLVPFA